MKKYLLIALLMLGANLFAQNNLSVNVNGLKANDSVRIIIQKSAEKLLKKWVKYNSTGTSTVQFNVDNGKWALIIDATGYTFPSSTVINIPEINNATVTLTPLLNTNYIYNWKDDDSYAGHATQVYVNEPSTLVVLNNTVSIPNDYSSVKLRNEFGIILSNDRSKWSSEDSFRLYSMLKTLPLQTFGEGSVLNFEKGENVKAIFYLTDQEQYKDINIVNVNGVKHVTVSQSAFTYASPQIGILDGIKMKFYSKRLNHAILNYYTDFGSNEQNVDKIAQEKYGFRFLKSNLETQNLMHEDASNFQEFFNEEKIEILSMFEELPEGFHKQDGLKYLVRRVNGQDHPIYTTAAAIAWTSLNTIEFMSKTFNNTEINSVVRRLILHEKSHFLWAYAFDSVLKKDWSDLGGWFQDPTSGSGWSTYNTTEFVTEYAHEKNPDEDMAESIATYILNPDLLLSRSVRKYEFIRDRIMHGTRYKAQIREDLTFMVYNLFPDYTYPGKIIGSTINVEGSANEDKIVKFEFKLNSKDPKIDGASVGYIRLASSIGTIHDLWLTPKNGSVDSTLVGTTTFSKHEKNGYWNLVSLRIEDPVGNSRFENTSSFGFKLYIENPLEDITPPKWQYNLKSELVQGKFDPNGQNTSDDVNGLQMQAIKYTYDYYDNSPMDRSITRIYFPKLDNSNAQRYEEQIQGKPIIDVAKSYKNDYNSLKHFEMHLVIPEYFPSGYYSVSQLNSSDIAGNYTNVYMVKDTANFYIKPGKLDTFKDIRDSLYVKTNYPDYIAPEIDLNRINVIAKPTNPLSPDGETRVDISLLTRDLSDFPTHESGTKLVRYVLRDPLGIEHGYSSWNDNMLLNYYSLKPDGNSEWKLINLDILLPKGSPPGKWGISSMQTIDRAGNFRNYSFVEIVRFDVIESDIKLEEALVAKITSKVVNSKNVSSISAEISCKPCQGNKYVYQVYSLLGGNVVRGEGVFTSNFISLDSINLSGVLDGIIKLTVQVTDNQNQLIATTTTDYTKDTVLPKGYYLKSNLQDNGSSNVDSIVFKVLAENVDINGAYKVNFEQKSTTNKQVDIKNSSTSSSSISFEGVLAQSEIVLNNLNLSSLKDGILSSTIMITDPNGNDGLPLTTYYYKLNGKLSVINKTTAVNDFIEVDEGKVATVLKNGTANLLDNDFKLTTNLTPIIVTNPINGTLTLNSNGTFSYVHNGSETLSDSFTYKITEGATESNLATVTVTVNPVNDAPVATSDQIAIKNGEATTLLVGGGSTVLANDTDAEKNPLTALLVAGPTNGTLTFNSNGTFEYKHNGSDTVSDSFTYKTNDGNVDSNIATVNITIEAFTLPFDNFSIVTKSETCFGKNNGEITIKATKSYDYTAIINTKNYSFTNNNLTLTDLPPGVYTVCLGIVGKSFSQCFVITIGKGGSLTGKTSGIASNKVAIEITEGTAPFEVLINGNSQFTTDQSNFNIDVKQGDLIMVKSSIACEGIYSKVISDLTNGIVAFPNPTNGVFEIAIPTEMKEIYVELYSINSVLVSKGRYPVVNQKIEMNLENQTSGTYIAKVYSDVLTNLIILKN
jgi:VCBS repeat-containing protein